MNINQQQALKRHRVYENRFAKAFYKVLSDNSREIAKNLLNGTSIDSINTEPMERVYKSLYTDIMAKEGKFIWNLLVSPITGERIQKKDIFDDIAGISAPETPEQLIAFWTGLMNGFLTYYISQRILQVYQTTIRRANEQIEQGRLDGLTDKEIANMIRADQRARELRANTIARTEATTAMNKSWMLALESSGIEWEKSWNALRDAQTRDSHWQTDPQLWIPIKDYFIIGGYEMAHPGDSNQGAVIKEFINCRCFLRFRQKGQTRAGFRPIQRI